MQVYDLTIKKRPKQQRAQATFDAIVEACAKLLIEQGYAATTTNHIADRAGVAISSLYQYFATKDGVIAEVANRLIQRIMESLASNLPELNHGERKDVKTMIEFAYQLLKQERDLIRVLAYEVPYAKEFKNVETIPDVVTNIAQAVMQTNDNKTTQASIYLNLIFVSSTLLILVLHPPEKVSVDEMIDTLVLHLESHSKVIK